MYDALTALAMRALRFYDVRTALTAVFSVEISSPFGSFGQVPVEFGKIEFLPSKFRNIYSV